METNNWAGSRTGETTAEGQGSGKSTGFENLKNMIADKLHYGAEVLGEKAANQDTQSCIAQHESRHPNGCINQQSTFGNSTVSR
jgi:hypothetical protein